MGGLILAVGGRSPLVELVIEVRWCTRVCASALSVAAIEGATIVEAIDMDRPLSLPIDEAMLVVLVCDPGGPYPWAYPGFGDVCWCWAM